MESKQRIYFVRTTFLLQFSKIVEGKSSEDCKLWTVMWTGRTAYSPLACPHHVQGQGGETDSKHVTHCWFEASSLRSLGALSSFEQLWVIGLQFFYFYFDLLLGDSSWLASRLLLFASRLGCCALSLVALMSRPWCLSSPQTGFGEGHQPWLQGTSWLARPQQSPANRGCSFNLQPAAQWCQGQASAALQNVVFAASLHPS